MSPAHHGSSSGGSSGGSSHDGPGTHHTGGDSGGPSGGGHAPGGGAPAGKSGFGVNIADLGLTANKIRQRSARMQDIAARVHSINIGVDNFGVTGQAFAGGLNEHIGHTGDVLTTGGKSLEDMASRVDHTAQSYQQQNSQTAQSFHDINPDRPNTYQSHGGGTGGPRPGPSATGGPSPHRPPKQVGFAPGTKPPAEPGGGGTHAQTFDPNNLNQITGNGTHHQTGQIVSGAHPLKPGGTVPGTDLESGNSHDNYRFGQESQQNAAAAQGNFSNKKRPGMGGALQVGDHVIPHSSMKGGVPNRHPVVQQALDNIPDDRRGNGHGQCAEIGSISDYLHTIDPNHHMTLPEALHHFEQNGAVSSAHLVKDGTNVAPCLSCQQVVDQLGIASMQP